MSNGAVAGVAQVVMTVMGPRVPAELRGPVCCREWLLNDQAVLLEHAPEGGRPELLPGDRLELANLALMRRWPFRSLHNMHISLEDAARELCGPFRDRGPSLVVLCAPSAYWHQASPQQYAAALVALSRQAGNAQLISGAVPAPGSLMSEADLEAGVARIVSDLAVGYPGGGPDVVHPGLIGELCLWEPTSSPPVEATLALRVCVEAQRRTGAPLLLSGPVTAEAYAILKGGVGEPAAGSCIWSKCAFFDVPSSSPVQPSQLTAHGALLGFCPPHGAADIARPFPGARPWKTENHFASALSSVPKGQALVSSGLRFRTDLASGGGVGLDYAMQLLQTSQHDLRAFDDAAIAFLQYPWKPPVPPEAVIHEIACQWCGTLKNRGDLLTKFDFDYCSGKCLNAHRKADFAPDAKAGRMTQ